MEYIFLLILSISTICCQADVSPGSKSDTCAKPMPSSDCRLATNPPSNQCIQEPVEKKTSNKPKPEPKNDSGNCNNLLSTSFWTVGGAVFGLIASGAVRYFLQTIKYKKETLMRLYHEIDQEEMMASRVDANRLIALKLPLNDNLKELYNSLPNMPFTKIDNEDPGFYIEDLKPIWFLTGFYERLEKSIQLDLIDKRESAIIFFELFAYYYLFLQNNDLEINLNAKNLKNMSHGNLAKHCADYSICFL